MDMRLTLLGTGNPRPNPHRAGPSQHIQIGGTSILVDCGSGVVRRMVEAGLRVQDIDYIFLTHLHSDHCIDLMHVLLSGWISFRTRPLQLIGPPGTREHLDSLMRVFDWDIRVRRLSERVGAEMLRVDCQEIEHGWTMGGKGWQVTAARVDHYPVEHAFAFRFDAPERSIAISGDTAPCQAMIDLARGVDILVHEGTHPTRHEGAYDHLPKGQVEAHFDRLQRYHTRAREAGRIAREAGAKLLVLSHLGPSDESPLRTEAEEAFGGPVVLGADLMVL
ncbi:MAG: MBL fold metallo-hydrolase [Chloroflexi bacterium]|nr:MBL fold metallo-hydrolase [Chloroflexota bacterium]